jgi:hypothetical protein
LHEELLEIASYGSIAFRQFRRDPVTRREQILQGLSAARVRRLIGHRLGWAHRVGFKALVRERLAADMRAFGLDASLLAGPLPAPVEPPRILR